MANNNPNFSKQQHAFAVNPMINEYMPFGQAPAPAPMQYPDASTSAEKKRSKVTTACDFCRTKKIRCDGENPCSSCVSLDIDCVFPSQPAKRRGPKKQGEKLESSIMQILGMLQTLVDEKQNPKTGKERKQAIDAIDLETLWKTREELRNEIVQDQNPASDQDEETMTQIDRGMKRLKLTEAASVVGEAGGIYYDTPHPRRLWDAHIVTMPIHAQEELVADMPPLERQKELADIYFRVIHPHYPILHRQTFMEALLDPKIVPDQFLLNVVFYLSILFQNYPYIKGNQLDLKEQARPFHERAMHYANVAYHVPRVSTVQAYVLICRYMTNFLKGYTYAGMAIRMAFDLGLHRNVLTWNVPLGIKQSRQRAWWGLFIFDRYCSISTGRPCFIQLHDCECPPPEAGPNDTEDEKDALLIFRRRIDLAMVAGKIHRHAADVRRDPATASERTLEAIQAALDGCLEGLPTVGLLRGEFGPMERSLEMLFRSAHLLRIYYTNTILLYQPYNNIATNSPHISDELRKRAFDRCSMAASQILVLGKMVLAHCDAVEANVVRREEVESGKELNNQDPPRPSGTGGAAYMMRWQFANLIGSMYEYQFASFTAHKILAQNTHHPAPEVSLLSRELLDRAHYMQTHIFQFIKDTVGFELGELLKSLVNLYIIPTLTDETAAAAGVAPSPAPSSMHDDVTTPASTVSTRISRASSEVREVTADDIKEGITKRSAQKGGKFSEEVMSVNELGQRGDKRRAASHDTESELPAEMLEADRLRRVSPSSATLSPTQDGKLIGLLYPEVPPTSPRRSSEPQPPSMQAAAPAAAPAPTRKKSGGSSAPRSKSREKKSSVPAEMTANTFRIDDSPMASYPTTNPLPRPPPMQDIYGNVPLGGAPWMQQQQQPEQGQGMMSHAMSDPRQMSKSGLHINPSQYLLQSQSPSYSRGSSEFFSQSVSSVGSVGSSNISPSTMRPNPTSASTGGTAEVDWTFDMSSVEMPPQQQQQQQQQQASAPTLAPPQPSFDFSNMDINEDLFSGFGAFSDPSFQNPDEAGGSVGVFDSALWPPALTWSTAPDIISSFYNLDEEGRQQM